MPPSKFDRSLLPASPDLQFEKRLWETGILRVAGIDEAGRGALAGPVAAAAVILPADPGVSAVLRGVRDSKEMTPVEREQWAEVIRRYAAAWALGFASNVEIDALGIVPATQLAARRALQGLALRPEHLLIDYWVFPSPTPPCTGLVKGDARSLSIAAASVLAKTARDALLVQLDRDYPAYGFAAHKGYGTFQHRRQLAQLGPCPVHRLTFSYSRRGFDE